MYFLGKHSGQGLTPSQVPLFFWTSPLKFSIYQINDHSDSKYILSLSLMCGLQSFGLFDLSYICIYSFPLSSVCNFDKFKNLSNSNTLLLFISLRVFSRNVIKFNSTSGFMKLYIKYYFYFMFKFGIKLLVVNYNLWKEIVV